VLLLLLLATTTLATATTTTPTATLAATAAPLLLRAVVAAGRHGATGRSRRDGTRRNERRAAANGPRAWRTRNDRTRTRTVRSAAARRRGGNERTRGRHRLDGRWRALEFRCARRCRRRSRNGRRWRWRYGLELGGRAGAFDRLARRRRDSRRLVLDLDSVIGVGELGDADLDVGIVRCGKASIARELGGPATPANPRSLGGRWRWRSGGRGCGSGGPTPAARRRRGLLFRPDALLTLPTRADARDLVVREQSEMAAHGNVHLTKNRDDFVAGDPELAGHVVYAKLAQTILLAGSNRTRSLPLDGGRLDEGTDAPRELWIDDADRRRRLPSDRSAKLGRRRRFDHPDVLRPKHRNDLVQTVA